MQRKPAVKETRQRRRWKFSPGSWFCPCGGLEPGTQGARIRSFTSVSEGRCCPGVLLTASVRQCVFPGAAPSPPGVWLAARRRPRPQTLPPSRSVCFPGGCAGCATPGWCRRVAVHRGVWAARVGGGGCLEFTPGCVCAGACGVFSVWGREVE